MDAPPLLRPLGVTLLGVAMVIGSVFALIAGVFSIGISGFVSDYLDANQIIEQNPMLPPDFVTPQLIESVVLFIGVSALFVGAANLLVAYGLLKGAEWGRLAVIIFALIGVILGLLSVAPLGAAVVVWLLINGAIVYYLTRPHVAEYFRTPK